MEIMEDEVKRLGEISTDFASILREEYEDFFNHLATSVVGARGKGTGAMGDSYHPPDFIAPYTSWESLTPEWMRKKELQVDKGAPYSTLEFYHGLTAFLKQQGRYTIRKSKTKGKGKLKKSRPGQEPFADFVSRRASEPGLTSKLFGPIQFSYSMVRPDGGKVNLTRLGDAIKIAQQFRPTGVGRRVAFASFLEGTKLVVSISAFTKVDPNWEEAQLIEYMIKKEPSNKGQWGKVNALVSRYRKIRPIVMPLMAWYVSQGFKEAIRKEYG